MKENTHLASAVTAADAKAAYDAQAKKLLSDRQLLAWIMKYTVKEFENCTMEETIAAIEGEPEVASVPVYPGLTGRAVTGMPQESSIPGEGTATFDVRFFAIVPGGERIKLILDVEAQKEFDPGYDLVSRGIFYNARQLSAQMDTEFTGKDYRGIKKVYSIWICISVPEKYADTITEYSIQPRDLYGNYTGKDRYDLASVLMIRLPRYEKTGKDMPQEGCRRLLDLLSLVFTARASAAEKIEELETKYGIETSIETGEGMERMCNLSDLIEKEAIEKGIQQGIQEGIQQGMQEGLQQGMQKGIQQGMQEGIQQGMLEGIQQGMQKGKLDMLVSLVKDGLVTAVEAAKRAGLTQEEFQKKLIQ